MVKVMITLRRQTKYLELFSVPLFLVHVPAFSRARDGKKHYGRWICESPYLGKNLAGLFILDDVFYPATVIVPRRLGPTVSRGSHGYVEAKNIVFARFYDTFVAGTSSTPWNEHENAFLQLDMFDHSPGRHGYGNINRNYVAGIHSDVEWKVEQ